MTTIREWRLNVYTSGDRQWFKDYATPCKWTSAGFWLAVGRGDIAVTRPIYRLHVKLKDGC